MWHTFQLNLALAFLSHNVQGVTLSVLSVQNTIHSKLLLLLLFYGHYTGQSALTTSHHLQLRTRGFCFDFEQLYSPHALADDNYYIRIGKKTLEFSVVLPALPQYHSKAKNKAQTLNSRNQWISKITSRSNTCKIDRLWNHIARESKLWHTNISVTQECFCHNLKNHNHTHAKETIRYLCWWHFPKRINFHGLKTLNAFRISTPKPWRQKVPQRFVARPAAIRHTLQCISMAPCNLFL